MKLFIDFDDVLFFSKKFIQDEKNIFLKHGISEELFKKHYYHFRENDKNKKYRFYDLDKQLEGIRNELGMDISPLEKEAKKFIEDTSRYVFPDVESFLKEIKKDDLFILSYSKTEFQRLKIENCRLARYFRKIIITDRKKSEAIMLAMKENDIKKGEDIYFIDDRADYISEVKKSLPQVKTILVRRKEGRYHDLESEDSDYEVENFSQVFPIIK